MPILQTIDNELIIHEERFSFSFHFSNNISWWTLLLGLFPPDSRASCDQMNGKKEDVKFWALHTFQYLDYKA